MKKRWNLLEPDRDLVCAFQSQLGASPILARLLALRGCKDPESAHKFLNPSYRDIHDPYLMLGMNDAVSRVLKAVDSGEKILIYGDYDVDGTTGTVILRRALQMLGSETAYHVPHRFTEGYGIRQTALEKAHAEGFSLVITVDCGIRAHEPLNWAQSAGLEVIVTDHHLPDDHRGAPPAFCVLNPNQNGCQYPDKNLAGVGVAFKLVHALLRERGREHLVKYFLKIVAIGTVADVAQLSGENRAIVSLGLVDLPKTPNQGLQALMWVAGYGRGQELTSTDLAFRIAPRINAAGRMDAATTVVELFEARELPLARQLAMRLDALNRERQKVQAEILRKAIAELDSIAEEHSSVAVITGEGWHRGVIGLAASKVAERLNRPCVVISFDEDGVGHGSGRSIEPYHLLNGLTVCADLFQDFGGHSHAAGLSISRNCVDEFRRRLAEHAASLLSEDDLTAAIQIDAEILPESLSLSLVDELRKLEPFGSGNPAPTFMTRGVRLASEPRLINESHLELRLEDTTGRLFEAIWWNGVEELEGRTLETNNRIEIAYRLQARTFGGESRLQLNVLDVKLASAEVQVGNSVH